MQLLAVGTATHPTWQVKLTGSQSLPTAVPVFCLRDVKTKKTSPLHPWMSQQSLPTTIKSMRGQPQTWEAAESCNPKFGMFSMSSIPIFFLEVPQSSASPFALVHFQFGLSSQSFSACYKKLITKSVASSLFDNSFPPFVYLKSRALFQAQNQKPFYPVLLLTCCRCNEINL